MEEKILARGKTMNIKVISLIIFAVIAIIPNAIMFINNYTYMVNEWDRIKANRYSWEGLVKEYGENVTPLIRVLDNYKETFFVVVFAAVIVACLFFVIFRKTELVVTDKKVYGKTSWGKRVDLPLDSISAVGTAILKSIAVTTASGSIKFSLITNRDEIHSVISKLLAERQENNKKPATIKQEMPQNNADELKKYKDLLDSGVISQEEFDAKKKQLLGI